MMVLGGVIVLLGVTAVYAGLLGTGDKVVADAVEEGLNSAR